MRISLDMDSVIAESVLPTVKWIQENKGQTFEVSQVSSWDWIQDTFKLTLPEVLDMYGKIWGGWWNEVPPTEEDITSKVQKLNTIGDMMIVTSANPEQATGKLKWMKKWGLQNIPLVIVPYNATKEALLFDVYIDDRAQTCLEVAKVGKLALVYRQPWNAGLEESSNLIYIKDLNEAIKQLEERGVSC
ncbi:MAG: hypothetical protein E6L02_04305 [Thaumarchaeota archaeon]|nr:MAG: hypothetical protein E6L02_04305 [Nitrososphaerota archaeon]